MGPSDRPVLILDASPVWLRELFGALGRLVPTVALLPHPHRLRWLLPGPKPRAGSCRHGATFQSVAMTRHATGRLARPLAPLNVRLLRRACPDPRAVIFTSPLQRHWVRGFAGRPRVYHVSDDFRFHYGWKPHSVYRWERKILGHVDAVSVVSQVLKDDFQARYGVSPHRIHVVPNGLPADAIPARPLDAVAPLSGPLGRLSRPVAGVLGTIGSRLRLDWLRDLVEQLPWLSWAFVGTVDREGLGPARRDLDWLLAHPRCVFTKHLPYRDMFQHAASFDVAVLPFAEDGLNRAGSAVRFYSQLPFGRPMLASPGFLEVEAQEPIVAVCPDRRAMGAALQSLRARGFDDGLAESRWKLAAASTWDVRAAIISEVLEDLGSGSARPPQRDE